MREPVSRSDPPPTSADVGDPTDHATQIMKSMWKTLASLVLFFGSGAMDAWADGKASKVEFFESRIRPVLVKHCYKCHSAESGQSKGGLHLDSLVGWKTGGDSGAALIPGKPEESNILLAIRQSGEVPEMPPSSKLPPQTIEDFRKWIADGAVDPREGHAPIAQESSIDIEEGRKFWSFQPRRRFTGSQTIDGFIDPQAPPAPADRLVRRLFLDLIGLPPTQDERLEFLRLYHERSPEHAVSVFADDLLSRNEFGEKWARHWLDVARYADSNGGDFNLTFPEAWRYRNYVIDAFNEDLPYDQFLREQIAGDLLPAGSAQQRNRQLIATGFLMIAPKMLTERNKPKMHLDIADEQVDTVGRSIMGLTLGCARCHDHKFDPIPTADYYALAGIFHSTRTADGVLMNNVNVTGWIETELALDEQTQALVTSNKARIGELEKEIEQQKTVVESSSNGLVVDDVDAERSGPWRKSTHRPNHVGEHYLATNKDDKAYSITWKARLPKPGRYELRVSFGGGSGLAAKAPYVIQHAEGKTRLEIDQTVKPSIAGLWHPIGTFTFGPGTDIAESTDNVPNSETDNPSATFAVVHLTNENAGGFVIADAIQLVHLDDLDGAPDTGKPSPRAKLKAMEQELKELEANTPEIPTAMAAQDHRKERFGDMHIRIRGETKNLGPKVRRGFLQVVSKVGSETDAIPEDQSGRLQLSQWLTDPNHPLTARVMVNRIWHHLFGRGIVATPDNFGSQGASPSHPELLDYLAEQFIANDWSMKFLIHEIVCSETYQQVARTPADNDQNNDLLRHQNRRPAPAETIRDSILAIAGSLDRKRRQSVVEQLGMYAIATSGKRDKSLGETGKLRQRSIYMPIVRGAVPPSLAIFDMPNPDLVTGSRSVTTVPAQALFMMNSPFVRDMALAVGSQIADEKLANEETIQQLYQRILIRDADSNDIEMARHYIAELVDSGTSQPEAIASFVQILFSSAEFRFIE